MPHALTSIAKRIPLRWSVLRFLASSVSRTGQVGDGRERALLDYVTANTGPGDLDGVIEAIDRFAREKTFLMNVGDEKGLILDAAVRQAQPSTLLELGTYCGYSSLRTARAMPADARLICIEASPANAEIARAVQRHAGVADRVSVVAGMIGDNGVTVRRLTDEYGITAGSLDFVFIDHAKQAYLPDLRTILEKAWLHRGSVVVADNVKTPGAPDYLAYMREHEGGEWRTVEHDTHVEYQPMVKDLVLVSTYAGPPQ
ncbi:O-methyltransferase [Skermania sp. ID1734]|uniref:O-methyltransferase n=1 Tax=Skermania sp. ID1734 TaxID=2597516 RepID=UPI00118112F6|nr:O-methyltransferase [Skermania sp. ID1734]TSE01663.1 O-methyltransferase [Skermania sp. ID1734]